MTNLNIIPSEVGMQDIVFACIGSDRSTGDALGPIVGTKLKRIGFHVVGTLDDTLNAVNLVERIEKEIPKDKIVIAVDASLGRLESIGNIEVKSGPCMPGKGVHKNLPAVGDYSIEGVVNVSGFAENYVLAMTPLSRVIDMADRIVDMIGNRFLMPEFTQDGNGVVESYES